MGAALSFCPADDLARGACRTLGVCWGHECVGFADCPCARCSHKRCRVTESHPAHSHVSDLSYCGACRTGGGSTARYLCKVCGAESPTGIGYVMTAPGALPAPAADCPNPHALPVCSQCREEYDAADPHAGYGMCAGCVHDALRSGWSPGD